MCIIIHIYNCMYSDIAATGTTWKTSLVSCRFPCWFPISVELCLILSTGTRQCHGISCLSHSFCFPHLWTHHQEVMPKSCLLLFPCSEPKRQNKPFQLGTFTSTDVCPSNDEWLIMKGFFFAHLPTCLLSAHLLHLFGSIAHFRIWGIPWSPLGPHSFFVSTGLGAPTFGLGRGGLSICWRYLRFIDIQG